MPWAHYTGFNYRPNGSMGRCFIYNIIVIGFLLALQFFVEKNHARFARNELAPSQYFDVVKVTNAVR